MSGGFNCVICLCFLIPLQECSEDAGQIAQSKAPKEDQALSRSIGHAVAPAAKDEEEEEGDKIMAELQVCLLGCT